MMKIGLSDANKTLALAGIFQAAHLVNQIAFSQLINEKAYTTSLESIFYIKSSDVLSVFGNSTNNLQLGLSYLIYYGTSKPPFKEKILLRYILYMSKLAKKVIADKKIFEHITKRLTPIVSQSTHLGCTHRIVIHELATLYRQVFLTRHLEIPVLGKISSFKNNEILDQIYAVLLSGIRSAVLWHQLGGSMLQLFFSRTRLRNQAIILLKHEWQSLVLQ